MERIFGLKLIDRCLSARSVDCEDSESAGATLSGKNVILQGLRILAACDNLTLKVEASQVLSIILARYHAAQVD